MGFNNDGLSSASSVQGYASRLEYNVVRNFQSVIVLVNLNMVKGADLAKIADYIAMVGLAHIHPGANVGGAATILRLFDSADGSAPAGLTSWDKSFLRALYDTRQGVRGQRTEISEHMVRDIAP
jgi:hypothetical protein